MKKHLFTAGLLIACCARPALVEAQTTSKPADAFRLFSHMLGTWTMESKKGRLYEDWSRKDDRTLTGKSYYLAGRDTVIIEYHELVWKADAIFYMANPKNQDNHDQPVPFRLLSSNDGALVFENKAHDFPQRIVYRITPGSDHVLAWIEGDIGGKTKKIEYPYTKL